MKSESIMKVRLQTALWLLVLIVVVMSLAGCSQETISTATEWGVVIILSVITSGVCGTIIERVSGDALKKISFPLTIGPVSFSISLFFIAVLLLKFMLF